MWNQALSLKGKNIFKKNSNGKYLSNINKYPVTVTGWNINIKKILVMYYIQILFWLITQIRKLLAKSFKEYTKKIINVVLCNIY